MPPPWGIYPECHPYSAFWRMGGGEGHVEVWSAWWRREERTHAQAGAYFRSWPPPPVWLPWMIDVIWKPEGWHTDEDVAAETEEYFARTEALGFGGRADYERDMEDPRWDSEFGEDEVN
ncbi:hypothetical protein Q0M94_02810 [Deinococcus radiomollis]|uniref:hypothetical protein n=1 Tax=Deinococcus radiomollis TaxID=468916 RepID=UPI0038926FC5